MFHKHKIMVIQNTNLQIKENNQLFRFYVKLKTTPVKVESIGRKDWNQVLIILFIENMNEIYRRGENNDNKVGIRS